MSTEFADVRIQLIFSVCLICIDLNQAVTIQRITTHNESSVCYSCDFVCRFNKTWLTPIQLLYSNPSFEVKSEQCWCDYNIIKRTHCCVGSEDNCINSLDVISRKKLNAEPKILVAHGRIAKADRGCKDTPTAPEVNCSTRLMSQRRENFGRSVQRVRRDQNSTEPVQSQPADNTPVIGVTRVVLDADDKACEFRECNLGNMVADAFVKYVANHSMKLDWSNATIGIVHSGMLGKTIDSTDNEGKITMKQVQEAIKNDSPMYIFWLSGYHLKIIVGLSINTAMGLALDSYLQYSGLRVKFNPDLSALDVVVSIETRCLKCAELRYSLVNNSDMYKIVAPQDLVNGTSTGAIIQKNALNIIRLQDSSFEIVKWYIKTYQPITTPIEGRITSINTQTITGTASGSCIATLLLRIYLLFIISTLKYGYGIAVSSIVF